MRQITPEGFELPAAKNIEQLDPNIIVEMERVYGQKIIRVVSEQDVCGESHEWPHYFHESFQKATHWASCVKLAISLADGSQRNNFLRLEFALAWHPVSKKLVRSDFVLPIYGPKPRNYRLPQVLSYDVVTGSFYTHPAEPTSSVSCLREPEANPAYYGAGIQLSVAPGSGKYYLTDFFSNENVPEVMTACELSEQNKVTCMSATNSIEVTFSGLIPHKPHSLRVVKRRFTADGEVVSNPEGSRADNYYLPKLDLVVNCR